MCTYTTSDCFKTSMECPVLLSQRKSSVDDTLTNWSSLGNGIKSESSLQMSKTSSPQPALVRKSSQIRVSADGAIKKGFGTQTVCGAFWAAWFCNKICYL